MLHVGVVARAILPDFLMARVLLLMGLAQGMKEWVGRPGSEHAGK